MFLNWLNRIFRHISQIVIGLLFIFSPSIFANDNSRIVLLATTTSTENSGLLEFILPYMEADTGYSVRTISAGTGKALKMGEIGDVDILLVHAIDSEIEFIQSGYGVDRRQVMFNDFVVVGSSDDPGSFGPSTSLDEVFTRIASQTEIFVSRGDDSGTHKKELKIWQSVGINPKGDWYREVGQGMGKTLQIANELRAYSLTDRGTWIFSRDRLSMKIIHEGDKRLHNQYSVISVNPTRHQTNYAGAQAVSDWLVSETGQVLIDAYKINDQRLFYANAE